MSEEKKQRLKEYQKNYYKTNGWVYKMGGYIKYFEYVGGGGGDKTCLF